MLSSRQTFGCFGFVATMKCLVITNEWQTLRLIHIYSRLSNVEKILNF